jgi:hypothetical protein
MFAYETASKYDCSYKGLSSTLFPQCKEEKRDARDQLQGGLVVSRPDKHVYRDLLAKKDSTYSTDTGGQGFLTTYWRGRIFWLPLHYNFVASSLCTVLSSVTDGLQEFSDAELNLARVGDSAAGMIASGMLADEKIAYIHYHSRPKPWDCANASACPRS